MSVLANISHLSLSKCRGAQILQSRKQGFQSPSPSCWAQLTAGQVNKHVSIAPEYRRARPTHARFNALLVQNTVILNEGPCIFILH